MPSTLAISIFYIAHRPLLGCRILPRIDSPIPPPPCVSRSCCSNASALPHTLLHRLHTTCSPTSGSHPQCRHSASPQLTTTLPPHRAHRISPEMIIRSPTYGEFRYRRNTAAKCYNTAAMGRNCNVCAHPEREAIDAAIAQSSIPNRRIGMQYGFSEKSIRRHAGSHVSRSLVAADHARHATRADAILSQILQFQAKAAELGEKAEKNRDYRTALLGIREVRGYLELLTKVGLELAQQERGRYPTTAETIAALPPEKIAAVLKILEAQERGEMVDSTAIERIVSEGEES